VNQRLHLEVRGIVQGVCFRASARDQAWSLGLVGWVCNRRDGSVEIVAEGPEEDLVRLVDWCRKGPPGAQVRELVTSYGAATGEFARFEIGG
jgi:acylphosphatase